MTAMRALAAARKAGVAVAIEGENLALEYEGVIPDTILADLKHHKAEILSLLRPGDTPTPTDGPWPEPKITGNPPFGVDRAPSRFRAGWQVLLAGCPAWAGEWQWTTAIFDCRNLLGEWGADLLRLNWRPEDIFEPPYGLGWFLKGKHVTAIGPRHAFLDDGRVFERTG
jgi:hypothetical protein